MFKATEKGIIEFGKPIELTEDDQATLACAIATSSSYPSLRKVNGRWTQNVSMNILEQIHQVFDSEDPEFDINDISHEGINLA